ncbi:TPA: hypothetical protein U1343_002112 [Streptococcus suis]|nr:hypothetical protein [Streptococcus suis]HEM5235981.1 hypothetical protein [Streptococcus suis]HEM5243213.1 hypothetical protein [Streptococcus suis]
MIDRSYLPFESARLYQDRKMAKWMGFFLSEHTTALSDDLNKVTYLSSLTLEKKLLLLSQVYANQLVTRLELRTKKGIETVVGTIPTITREHLIIKTNEGHINVPLDDILSIELAEETQDESA